MSTSTMATDETVASTAVYCESLIKALQFNHFIRKLNIYASVLIIIVGLVGNCLAVFVFVQRRFRTHSSSIYLLFICLTDAVFLLVHFFEDTLRTYIDVYREAEPMLPANSTCFSYLNKLVGHNQSTPTTLGQHSWMITFLSWINITDRFNLTCSLVNYLRYFVRFLSAYFILAFTVQRTVVLRFSLNKLKFESNLFVWCIVAGLVIFGALFTLWVPFIFTLNNQSVRVSYCDVNRDLSGVYFKMTIIYVALTLLTPIVAIFLCNSVIIFYILKSNSKRNHLSNANLLRKVNNTMHHHASTTSYCYGAAARNHNMKRNNVKKMSTNGEELLGGDDEVGGKNGGGVVVVSLTLKNKTMSHQHQPADEFSKYYSLHRFSKSQNQTRLSPNSSATQQRRRQQQQYRSNLDSMRITRMLLYMSFSYAVLNLPYFISWCLFYYKIGIQRSTDEIEKHYLFASIQFAEIFYLLNYSVHFFIYCASGKRFRFLLKNALNTKCKLLCRD